MAGQQTHSFSKERHLHHWLALALGVCLTLSAGALYGKFSQRWGPPADLTAAATHLESLPHQIGNWKLAEESPMGKPALEMLQCAGYVNRCYVNQQSGQTVNLAIIVGPPGPTAVHTPEICYSSRAYDVQGNRQKIVLESSPTVRDSFWAVDFSTKNPLADGLRVYYAWSRGGSWEASASPRYEFGAEPLLYKLQLAGPIGRNKNDKGSDSCHEFLEDLLKTSWTTAARG
jgi:Protein of unknown function (DUF3485)